MAKTAKKKAPSKATKKAVVAAPRRVWVRAKFDAAQTTAENRRHWANADACSPDAAFSTAARKALRERAEYEAGNNSYLRGIVETLANDCIGTGPRLQLRLKSPEVNREIEREFKAWTVAIGLPDKLRTIRKCKAVRGEGFGLFKTNERLPTTVKLTLVPFEPDLCATPGLNLNQPVDGIELDAVGEPRYYHILREHPGSGNAIGGFGEYDRVAASDVIHYFRADRAGQHRGIPDITPALPLFAQLRRYTLAVIAAAETAADFAAVLESDGPASETEEATPFETLELEQRMMTVLPSGTKLNQIKAEQPTTTYGEFKKEILNEIARCLNMPFNVAAGNSSSYNYSSGRLDHQTYYRSIDIERSVIEAVILDRLLAKWLREAIMYRGYLSDAALATLETVNNAPPHAWFWDGQKHVDPQKEANAEQIRLASRTTTYAQVFADQGADWEEEFEQMGRELARMKQLGIPVPGETQPAADQADPANQTNQDEGQNDEA